MMPAKSPAKAGAKSPAKSPSKDGGYNSFTNAERADAVTEYEAGSCTFNELAIWFQRKYKKPLGRATWNKWWKGRAEIMQRALDPSTGSSKRLRCSLSDGVGVALYKWYEVAGAHPGANITHKDLSEKAKQIVQHMPPGIKKSNLLNQKKFNASGKWVGNWCKHYKVATSASSAAAASATAAASASSATSSDEEQGGAEAGRSGGAGRGKKERGGGGRAGGGLQQGWEGFPSFGLGGGAGSKRARDSLQSVSNNTPAGYRQT